MLAPAKIWCVCPAAWADAPDSASQTGAIAGGFFSSGPVLPPQEGQFGPFGQAFAPAMPPMPASMAAAGAGLCGPAIAGASAQYRLPQGLLAAIATVESGRRDPQTGIVKPWPWTIDANGTGYLYPTEQAAERAAAGFQAAGIASLDIGCLQVNLVQHPDAFQNLAQAFDPTANAQYAAMFLTGLEQKFGSWPQAVAAYHSQTPALGMPYQARVYAQWQSVPPVALAAFAAPVAVQPGQKRPMPAMPQAFGAAAMQISAMLPPAQILARPAGAMSGRSLASYRATPVAIASGGWAGRAMPPG